MAVVRDAALAVVRDDADGMAELRDGQPRARYSPPETCMRASRDQARSRAGGRGKLPGCLVMP